MLEATGHPPTTEATFENRRTSAVRSMAPSFDRFRTRRKRESSGGIRRQFVSRKILRQAQGLCLHTWNQNGCLNKMKVMRDSVSPADILSKCQALPHLLVAQKDGLQSSTA
jgi:hypothetical protein